MIQGRKSKKKTKEAIQALEEKIHDLYGEYTRSIRTTTGQALSLGKKFIALKKLVKGKSEKWSDYVRDNFPEIDIRDIQRFMALASKVSEDCPALLSLSQNKLRQLVKSSEGEDIEEYLRSANINLNFDTGNPDLVKTFQEDVNRLVRSSDTKKAGEKMDTNNGSDSHHKNESRSKKSDPVPSKSTHPSKIFAEWLTFVMTQKNLAPIRDSTRKRLKKIRHQLEQLLDRLQNSDEEAIHD